MKLYVQKYNQQYPQVTIKKLKTTHDRCLIIDDDIIYHIGASLKDLGKKWFTFSRIDKEGIKIVEKLDKK